MHSVRFQDLITKGFSISNKIYFREFNETEFQRWINDCYSLIAACEPEPYFPCFPDPRHIEEIVMRFRELSAKISRGQVQYTGLL